MESQNVLADHVQISWPELQKHFRIGVGIADGGDVVGQRIEPHIHYVVRIVRHRHTPFEAGPRDRKILQPALDEAHHLVAPARRGDRIEIVLVIADQPVLPL